jgi:hypothetical protein
MLRNAAAATVAVGAMFVTVSTAQAVTVQFDLSSYFNYDAVATSLEMSNVENAVGKRSLRDFLGDHSISNTRAYTNQGSVGSGTALPDDGLVGPYQFSTAYDNGTDGLTKSNNTIGFTPNAGGNPSFLTQTINLGAGEQGQYSSINMAFVSANSSNHSSSGFRSWMVAHYTDGSSEIFVDTGLVDGNDPEAPGGYFGGGGQGGNGGLFATVDNYTFQNQAPNYPGTIGHSLLLEMNRRLDRSGSVNAIRSGTASVWEFSSPLAVDSSKVLQDIEINVQSAADSVNRDTRLWVFAMNGELAPQDDTGPAIPEPASLGLIGLAGAMLLARRR